MFQQGQPPISNSPIGFVIANLAAGSIMPFAMLLDVLRVPGGDGLQDFLEMILYLIVALIITVVSIWVGIKRNESLRWLIYTAIALWILPLMLFI